ncbi:hypothetical protein H0Z11_04180 [Pantoea agglomerans]|uniref:hypothetical protein n=1 Tax=Enterobacter agglomerans TaxID=549 RepID=UPI001AA09002|nr:hypothetical protein [Pantoea agglomerans]QTC51083.1 hypothetical protein H0Z11_04180 [Pantoea agglomerans]
MTAKKNENQSSEEQVKIKTCFVIMPIADHPDYDVGHFTRVYEHLIKPACLAAGYQPIRADDSKASHMIMFDILKKIMDCDMAICDLSSKNANVFYELGLRQAFNKKTILITDGRDKPPFDLAGFRYVPYSQSLRVDTVNIEIKLIQEMLTETESAPDDDVNSIVKLLKIQPAKIDKVDLSKNDTIIFDMINKLNRKIDNLGERDKNSNLQLKNLSYIKDLATSTNKRLSLYELIQTVPNTVAKYSYSYLGMNIGFIAALGSEFITFIDDEGEERHFSRTKENLQAIFVNSN